MRQPLVGASAGCASRRVADSLGPTWVSLFPVVGALSAPLNAETPLAARRGEAEATAGCFLCF